MHIILDGRLVLPHMTGIGRYILGLIQGYKSINSDDTFEIWMQTAVYGKHPLMGFDDDKFTFRCLSITHMNFRQQWQIPLALKNTRFNLFHYPHFDLPFATPSPIIATIHDLKYIAQPGFFPHMGNLKKAIIRLMITHTCQKAKYIITDSSNTAQDLSTHLNISSEKLKVVPLGVSTEYSIDIPSLELDLVSKKYGIEKPFILFIGERRPHKNLVGLIEAFYYFNGMTSRTYQLGIGGKPYADYCLPGRKVEDFQLNQQVVFIDDLQDEDLPALYKASEVFVTLSYYEGFGLPVLEAMASGTPVVSSNTTSLPEVCGGAAILVPPDQPEEVAVAISQVMKGGQNRDQNIYNGKKRATEMSWENCARMTIDVYNLALSQRD